MKKKKPETYRKVGKMDEREVQVEIGAIQPAFKVTLSLCMKRKLCKRYIRNFGIFLLLQKLELIVEVNTGGFFELHAAQSQFHN